MRREGSLDSRKLWSPSRPLILLLVIGALALVALGCGSTADGITADTTCEEYLSSSSEERHDAAIRISSEVDGVSSPGNPMWGLSLDGACGSSPSMTIGEYFDQG